MKVFVPFVLIVCSMAATAYAQVPEREEAASQVRGVIKTFGYKAKPVRVLLRSLIEIKGKAIGATDDSFDLKPKGERTLVRRVRYIDVLTFRGGGVSLNFIPEQNRKPYGRWDDLKNIYPGTPIVLALNDGTAIDGWSHSATETHLVITERRAHARRDIPREQIIAFYGLLGVRGGAKSGASKAAYGLGRPDLLTTAVGIGVGAIIGALAKDNGTPVLVFAK